MGDGSRSGPSPCKTFFILTFTAREIFEFFLDLVLLFNLSGFALQIYQMQFLIFLFISCTSFTFIFYFLYQQYQNFISLGSGVLDGDFQSQQFSVRKTQFFCKLHPPKPPVKKYYCNIFSQVRRLAILTVAIEFQHVSDAGTPHRTPTDTS